MKKLITLLFLLSLVMYVSGTSYAQTKGAAHGPAINGGPSVNPNHGSGKLGSDQHANHPQVESADKNQKDWQTRFGDRMQKNATFRTKIESLLPEGASYETAASGFKNQGRFIAALHVSKNLNIPFDQLKATMLGLDPATMQPLAGAMPKSLGQAIHELRPDITESQVLVEVKRAGKQAKETENVPTNTTS